MITTIIGIVGAIGLLGLMVFIHELGHFVVAKRNGIVVEEFGFGYPPRLVTLFEHSGTKYTLNVIPFGGFARLKGENEIEGPGSFASAPKRVRTVVLVAGAGMNLVLAVVMLSAAFAVGYPVVGQGALIIEVLEGSAAAEAGLQVGDIILHIDDYILYRFDDLSPYVKAHPNQVIELGIRRGDDFLLLEARPQLKEGQGFLGIAFKPVIRLRRFPWPQALLRGLKLTGQFLWLTLSLPVLLLRGDIPVEVARPVGAPGIYQLASGAMEYALASGRWFAVLQLGGLLNAAVALTNLLPLPGLDGGRLLFIVAEAVRGKRVSPDREGTIHAIGMVVLIALMVFISIQDLVLKVPLPDWSHFGL